MLIQINSDAGVDYHEINEDNTDYLHLRCSGTWGVSDSKRMWLIIADRLKQTNVGKLLLDQREVEMETSVSIDFEHAGYVAELMRGICNKIAIVDVDEYSKINAFFETVCVNRSLNLKYFLQQQEAIDWLLE